MELPRPNWSILESLRKHFLTEDFRSTSYWESEEVLLHYHSTFAQRIGWKWESVLSHSALRALTQIPQSVSVVDWGCGTGIASEKFIRFLGEKKCTEIFLWDKSKLASSFARNFLSKEFNFVKIHDSIPLTFEQPMVLLLSHIINEISDREKEEVYKLMQKASFIFWVEPGTPKASENLIFFRDKLLDHFHVVAPCTHQGKCGMFEKKKDWCHFFASPPVTVFRSAFWKEFSQRLKIDLRALPVSFLVLSKNKTSEEKGRRVIGRARHYKGYSLVLTCSSEGVREEKLLSRNISHVIDFIKQNGFCDKID